MTNRSTRILVAAAASACALFLVSRGGPARADNHRNIVETAVKAGSFQTLVTAVKAAGLAQTLQGRGPFTVFAPSDEAFQKLEKAKPGTIQSLLKPENRDRLRAVLTYHVVPGKVMAQDVMHLRDGAKVKTVNGKSITIRNRGGVRVDNARVVTTDVQASNGVIHVIDSVILPR